MSALSVHTVDQIREVGRREAKATCCPVCGAACTDAPLSRYTVAQAAAHFCPPARDPDRNHRLKECIARLWEGNECVILRCAACGFGFGYPFVAGDEEFYGILHEQKGYPSWRWDYDVAVAEAIEKFDGGNVLDIGAGVGMFLRGLDNTWQRHAVEGSEVTRRELEAATITVFRDLEEAARKHARTFQVVTLFQVLEHIAEFDSVLGHCNELLVPGGRLVVTVPDADAMIRQERVTGCADMPPNHLGKWTPRSLKLALRKAGFECSKPLPEPASMKNVKANLHMRLMADAVSEKSITGFAYKIRNRRLRIAALSILGVPALFRMLPYGGQLISGGAFAIVGQKPSALGNEAA